MKILIASDIHGSAYFCQKLLDSFNAEGADRLLLLGDILYHGPRNDLPRDYAPKKVAAMLNSVKDRILCVRGNCEAEVDSLMLDFPIMAENCILFVKERTIFATHGHHAGENSPPPHSAGDILLCGHTHVPACREHEDFVYLNPGSVSIPKENSENGYIVLDGDVFEWKTLDGRKYMEYKL